MGTPVARRGRKATGLPESAGLPNGVGQWPSGMARDGSTMTRGKCNREYSFPAELDFDILATATMMLGLAALFLRLHGSSEPFWPPRPGWTASAQ